MKRFTFLLCVAIAFGQVQVYAQHVSVRGKVINSQKEPLSGATVAALNTRLSVNTNADGEYHLEGLSAGRLSVSVSVLGYATKVVNVDLTEGTNEVNFTLEEAAIALEPVTVTAQQREQPLIDIPITVSAVSAQTLENTHTRTLEQLSAFVPGLNINIQTPHRPNLAIRGLTSDETSPTAQPRVSVYYNNVPTSRASMAVAELYDMESIEVSKGPQGTLFGRGSQIGAIHFITKKPASAFGGYLSVGLGSYAMKEVEGAINMPVVKEKLFARIAGIYSYQDGYVKNTSGGKLNGKNTLAGRFSVQYLPMENLQIDFMLSYQKDDNPGTAFMSKRYPNANGVSNIFEYEASLDEGKEWFNKRDVMLTSLDVKYSINSHSYLTSTTAFTHNAVDHRWDGDGTYAPAIDMQEGVNANQLTEDLRYHFSLNSKLSGFAGANYWREDVKYTHAFYPNEQYFVHLYAPMLAAGIDNAFGMSGALLGSVTQELASSNLFTPLAQLPVALQNLLMQSGMPAAPPLSTTHSEKMISGAVNQSSDIFADVTYEILPKLNITAGIRGTYERFETSTSAKQTDGDAATMGMLSGTYPNVFYKQRADTSISKNFLSLIYRFNLMYTISNDMSVFAGYSRGRRPNVLQFDSEGQSTVMSDETVHSFDAGFKWSAQQRYWLDLGAFYHKYNDFQTSKWDNASYLVDDAGRATSYGAEATVKAVLFKNLDVFGSYAYIHARFDDEDSDGNKQEYGGNTFRQTPENSFLLGLNACVNVSKAVKLVFTPTYSWKSHIWFEDSNDKQPEDPSLARLEQNAYGLLNVNLAVKFSNPELALAVFTSNLLGEKYIIGAGNTGMMFGVPTYVPGAPRMFGAKLSWRF
ncbi:MAG: TonB-dependent receptor [Prevotellaceae bacterium]|jgi:outer membrane receptor protein involved in Fe transport|nr:TonB-dependent receptor [Prevotellaceae bacterium]